MADCRAGYACALTLVNTDDETIARTAHHAALIALMLRRGTLDRHHARASFAAWQWKRGLLPAFPTGK